MWESPAGDLPHPADDGGGAECGHHLITGITGVSLAVFLAGAGRTDCLT
ncbi:hypothetical protein ACBJ59_60950 [Nonomuraea sp. MTCD27]